MATNGKKRKGVSKKKNRVIYASEMRRERNRNRKLAKQIEKNPNDTTNPNHPEYEKAEPHKPEKVETSLYHHSSVFDGKPRRKVVKKRKYVPRPMMTLSEVKITM